MAAPLPPRAGRTANVAVATSVLLTFISFWWAEASPASGQAGRPRGSLPNPATVIAWQRTRFRDHGHD
jgi:hypothetical protein